MIRKQANRAILLELYNLIEKYPDLRFGQILVNCDIIQEEEVLLEGERQNVLVGIDPFYEESEDTLNRMMKSRIISKEYN
jgi:hypothetical protein